MNLAHKSVLVTGGAGFIGSHLVYRIARERPDNLVVVDNFFLGKLRNLQLAKQEFPKLKLYDQNAAQMSPMESILRNERTDVLFNLAIIPLPKCLTNPKAVYDINVKLTSVVCDLARKDFFKTLIHFSSSEAYGNALSVPMTEDHPLKPTTPYGASKIASDHLVLSYIQTFGVDASIVRPFNAYGPRQNEGSYAGVIPLTIKRILHKKPPIIQGDGLQTRDFTYVTDLADATVRVYNETATRGEVLNIASGKEIQIKDLILEIASLLGSRKPPIFAEPRPGDVRRFYGSNKLAKELIGYEPKIPIEEGLQRTIDWYSDIYSNSK